MTTVNSPPDFASFAGVMQPFAAAATFNSITVTFRTSLALTLVGSTVTIQAQLFKVPYQSAAAGAVPGFVCTLAPALTGVIALGQSLTCLNQGASPATFNPGDAGFIVVSATATGLTLINTITGSVAVGISNGTGPV